MAWKDAQVVLFLTIVYNSQSTIIRPRKRPRITTQKDTDLWAGSVTKDLAIPVAINEYNHHMGSVDQADQSRKSYSRRTREYRTWKPLFRFLLQASVCNAAKLWIETQQRRHSSTQRSQTLGFRMNVAL